MKPRMGQGMGRAGPPHSAGTDMDETHTVGATSIDRNKELQRVEAALKRLDRGQFGHCLYCGDRIDLERLQHDPAVESCDTCRED